MIGFGLGILLAIGLKALLDAIGFDIPASHIVDPVSSDDRRRLLVGMVVTVISAIVPARKASRVPPIAAMRDVAIERRTGRRPADRRSASPSPSASAPCCSWGCSVCPTTASPSVGVGALVVFIGVFVLGPLFARPISRFIGAPLPEGAGHDGHARPRERDAEPEAHRRRPRPR